MASRCAGVKFKACAEAGALAESCGGACAAAIADKASSNAPATELVMEAFMVIPSPDRFGRPNRFRFIGTEGNACVPGWFREKRESGPRMAHARLTSPENRKKSPGRARRAA